ncbi:hypothetical protein GCM10027447_17730 [Glycomyces halotolerans]
MIENYAHSTDIVTDLPNEAREYWERRAAVAGVSLEEDLLQKLVREARLPSTKEVFDRIDREATGHLSSADAVAILREERDPR